MDSIAFAKAIETVLLQRGISKSEFYSACAISRASFSQWKNSKNEPSQEAIQRICSYLDLTFSFNSEGKMLGVLTSAIKKEKPAASDELSEKDMRLLNWFRSLPEGKQQAILTAQDAPEGLV